MLPFLSSYLEKTSLKGKTVVLTGASRGIGLEISRLFAQQGANIIGIARSGDRLHKWATDMAQYGTRVEGIAFDLSQTAQIPQLLQQIQERLHCWPDGQSNNQHSKEIDILINNAGIEIYRAFQDYDPEEIDRIIRVNLLSAMLLTQQVFTTLAPQGHIINIASLASKKGHPYDSIYAASKAGLLMWSHSLRQEIANAPQFGQLSAKTLPSVSVICPGYVVDTGMLADTGIKAPLLAGRSSAQSVANAVLKAAQTKPAEIIVNQDPITQATTRLLLAAEQIFPKLSDVSNRLLGITALNRQRAFSYPPKP